LSFRLETRGVVAVRHPVLRGLACPAEVAAEVAADSASPADTAAKDVPFDGMDLPLLPDLVSADVVADVVEAADADSTTEAEVLPGTFTLSSTDFEDGGPMKAPNVCVSYQDLGTSPALSWTGPSEGTLSYALTCIDPDGGNWVHWIAWNIPGDHDSLSAAIPLEALLEDGTVQGKNSFGNVGYGGPCPPPNGPHHYHFSLYALDVAALELPQDATTPKSLATAMEGHVLGTAKLVGIYENKE